MLLHHEGDVFRRVTGSVKDAELELAKVESVVVSQTDRRVKQAAGCALTYLTPGLGR